jgi:prepilin-type N-terminal cleavage/methylation domain-containing protein
MQQQGFTLIELVIVIAVVSIIGIISVMSWTGSAIDLGGQAKQLANDISYTQSLAMSKGTRYYLIITGTNTYQIRNASGTAQQ